MSSVPSRLPAVWWWLAWGWVAVALLLIFAHGRELSLDAPVSNRLRFHAIPVAASVLYHGRSHDYTAFQSLARKFQSPDADIDELIEWAPTAPLPEGDGTYYWAADDRGMADYVMGAFVLFGPHRSSLYFLYFVVLGVACTLMLIGFWRDPGMTGLLLYVLAAFYGSLNVMALASHSDAFGEPVALFEPRLMELLSLVPALHLGFAGWRRSPWTKWELAALAGQAAIFVFCYHARSSVAWQGVFVVGMSAAAIGVYGVRTWSDVLTRGDVFVRGVPVALLLVGVLALNLYKREAYHPRYFEDMGSRTVWHNALMGLSSSKPLAATYELSLSDASVVDAVLRDMRRRGDRRLSGEWTTGNILNSLGGWREFDWFDYEDAARSLYLSLWRNHPALMLRCYLVDQPRAALAVVWNGHWFNPVSPVPLLIMAPGLLFLTRGPRFGHLVGGMAVLAVLGLMPGLLFYPATFTMMGTLLSTGVLVYLLLAQSARRVVTRDAAHT